MTDEEFKAAVEKAAAGMYGKTWDGPSDKMPGERMKDIWRAYAANALSALAFREIVEALERSATAIDDWVAIYAPEDCDSLRVSQARIRVTRAGGTLAYTADVQANTRRVLDRLKAQNTTQETARD